MKGLSLYQLNEKVMELVVEIEAATAAENDALIAELEATLAELVPAINKKRESYVHVIKSSQAHAKMLRDEARQLNARAKQMENLAVRLTDTLHADMQKNGEVRAQAGLFQLRIANSPPRLVLSIPSNKLPEEYTDVRIVADTLAIREALKNGIEIEGAKLVRGTHLLIR